MILPYFAADLVPIVVIPPTVVCILIPYSFVVKNQIFIFHESNLQALSKNSIFTNLLKLENLRILIASNSILRSIALVF
jgi:hypothetical protein